jgi:hypothetical protein
MKVCFINILVIKFKRKDRKRPKNNNKKIWLITTFQVRESLFLI